jgi:hypothetical protein
VTAQAIRLSPPAGINSKRRGKMRAKTVITFGRKLGAGTLLSPAVEYPGDWVQFPNLNWLQPTFPSKGTAYALTRGAPLTLRFRVVVCEGDLGEATVARLWSEYAEATR